MKTLITLIFCGLSIFTFAQTSDYFQQEVNTTISATLDDQNHQLTGTIDIEYINNSPDDLPLIYLHLWANAYKNRRTAFAKQKLRTGSVKFYYAEDKDLGNFKDLQFTVDGEPARLDFDKKNPDIATLTLSKPLKSGEKIRIQSPFTLNIPASFSRLGHVGESYQMTQWFPKPAVYDKDGWHPMPYLDMGEFYSEFGSYDVTLTLPDNYVVGSTGVLETASEIAFLDKKIAETTEYLKTVPDQKVDDDTMMKDTFPTSSPHMKTIRYTAENVHDFAWFADKRFRVQKSNVTLASGKKVDTWVMFTKAEEEMWKTAINYVDRSVEFYSRLVGEYPYPQASAVQSALSAGGGMEYPMITVIGLMGNPQSLDEVITHEVGHNWFYGILGFNERDHVWMDEGLNSYYDHRYTDDYYKGLSISLPKIIAGDTKMSILEAGYLLQARRHENQAPATHSNQFRPVNYWLGGYEIPARLFRHLEHYLGTENFDPIMLSFYKTWEFKHPGPKDLRTHFEKESGKDLSWLFDDFIGTAKTMDYAVTDLKTGNDFEVTVKNVGDIAAPFPLSAIKDSMIINTIWYDGFEGSQSVVFPKGDYDEIILDAKRSTWELHRKDNNVKVPGGSKGESFEFKFLTKLENDRKKSVYWLPAVGFNNYDKAMVGVALHNLTLPIKNLEWSVAPMYSFASKSLTGLGNLYYHIYPKSSKLNRVSLSLNARTFSYNYDFDYKTYDKYYKIAPKLSIELGKKDPTSLLTQTIDIRHINISQKYTRGIDFATRTFERLDRSYYVNELKYTLKNANALAPNTTSITAHQGKGFSKVFLNFDQKFVYNKKKKGVYMTAFAGLFTSRDTSIVAASNFLFNGVTGFDIFQKDYLFDELLFGRNDDRGFFSNQIYDRDANLKTIGSLGSTTDWMIGLGLSADIPNPLPVAPYVNVAIAPGFTSDPDAKTPIDFLYSAGLSVKLFQNYLVVYLPLFESDAIKNSAAYGSRGKEENGFDDKPPFKTFLTRVTFKVDLKALNPHEIIHKIEF